MDHVPWPRNVPHLRVDSRGDGAPPQLAVVKGEAHGAVAEAELLWSLAKIGC